MIHGYSQGLRWVARGALIAVVVMHSALVICADHRTVANMELLHPDNTEWVETVTESDKTDVTRSHPSHQRVPVLFAPRGYKIPIFDGNVNHGEWDDAARYVLGERGGALVALYLKHFELIQADDDASGCLLYPNNRLFRIPCGRYLGMAFVGVAVAPVELLFDEGNNSPRGSGPRDYLLTHRQEDRKDWPVYRRTNFLTGDDLTSCDVFFGAVVGCTMPDGTGGCTPWSSGPCWQCDKSNLTRSVCRWSEEWQRSAIPTLLDVHVPGDGHFNRTGFPGWTSDGSLGYISHFNREYRDSQEFLIPFFGDALCTRAACSNVNFDVGDEIGVWMRGLYPTDATGDPGTWAGLVALP